MLLLMLILIYRFLLLICVLKNCIRSLHINILLPTTNAVVNECNIANTNQKPNPGLSFEI